MRVGDRCARGSVLTIYAISPKSPGRAYAKLWGISEQKDKKSPPPSKKKTLSLAHACNAPKSARTTLLSHLIWTLNSEKRWPKIAACTLQVTTYYL